MELIHELKAGKWILIHHRYVDDYGFKKDSFVLIDTKSNYHYPFMGMLKVMNYDRTAPLDRLPEYTKDDYKKMLEQEIAKIEGINIKF